MVSDDHLGVRAPEPAFNDGTACADREIRWDYSSGSERKLKPFRTEACLMEGAGPFIGLTGTLAEGLRSAPAIRDSNSRSIDPAIRIPTEHYSEIQLLELPGFLRLKL